MPGQERGTPELPLAILYTVNPDTGDFDRWVGPYLDKWGTYHGYDEVTSEADAWESAWWTSCAEGGQWGEAAGGRGAWIRDVCVVCSPRCVCACMRVRALLPVGDRLLATYPLSAARLPPHVQWGQLSAPALPAPSVLGRPTTRPLPPSGA